MNPRWPSKTSLQSKRKFTMSLSRFAPYISFLLAFLLAGQAWAGKSSVPPRPAARAAPAGAAKIETSLPHTSPVVAKLREELRVTDTKPSEPSSAPPVKAPAVNTAGATTAGGIQRPGYLSLEAAIRSRLESKDPIKMDAAAFEANGLPTGTRTSTTPPPPTATVSFTGKELVVDFRSGGTEIVKVELPKGNVNKETLRERLKEAVRILPKALETQPDRIEKILCSESNCTAVIGGKAFELIPAEQTERDKDEALTQVATR